MEKFGMWGLSMCVHLCNRWCAPLEISQCLGCILWHWSKRSVWSWRRLKQALEFNNILACHVSPNKVLPQPNFVYLPVRPWSFDLLNPTRRIWLRNSDVRAIRSHRRRMPAPKPQYKTPIAEWINPPYSRMTSDLELMEKLHLLIFCG